jgi:plasmid stabilization system protein ParE
MKPVRMTDAAMSDMDISMTWYEQQQSDLEHRFYQEIWESLTKISLHPSASTLILKSGLRRYLTKVFHFAIYFVEDRDEIVVFAILHQKMDFATRIQNRFK